MKAKSKLRNILTLGVFAAIIGGLFIANLIVPPPAMLVSERRAPAEFPKFTASTVMSGSFMGKFEGYAADRFALREYFRGLRAITALGVFMQADKGGLYFGQAGLGDLVRLDRTQAEQTARKLRSITESDLLKDCNLYYSIVPDKSAYAGKYVPGFDMAAAEKILSYALTGCVYIPLTGSVSAESYYKTDIHWDQSRINAVAERLCTAMGRIADLSVFVPSEIGEFRGGYAGQMALPTAPDSMVVMELPGLTASYLNDVTLIFNPGPVYDLTRFGGIDPYDVFLRGPQPLIVLENPSAPEGELYIFRDSFSSSLGPLMAGAYRRVTLIDLRYMDARVLGQFISPASGSDVLLLYSGLILNNPSVLKAFS